MQHIYQFIKYNSNTSIDSIIHKCKIGAVICFDLEDSICNWLDSDENNDLKNNFRKIINKILSELKPYSNHIKIGVRINSSDSKHQELDIESMPSQCYIHSILLPKVESKDQIDDVVCKLNNKNIAFEEIIPIVESKKGIENIEDIIKAKYKIKKVGFGHCDYNLSIDASPFFHQDSLEYWKWVNKIIYTLKKQNILFINSAYLNLDNSDFFISMLHHLQYLCKNKFGQFTLTYKQTILCRDYLKYIQPSEVIAQNRLNLRYSIDDLNNKVVLFELHNRKQGFTIVPENRMLISPQEYISAKKHLEKWKGKNIEFTFIGGCFPVQGDILFEDIFHQKLKNKIQEKHYVNFHVNIIRYEKFSNCLEKIKSHSKDNKIDYLVFHIRPEPFLRLIKFYYRYLNYENKHCFSFNMPFFRILYPEKYDLLMLSRRYNYNLFVNKSLLYKCLIDLNYSIGYFIGNYNYALKKYLSLIENIKTYCQENKIEFIVLGPAIRSNTFLESIFSKKLNNYMFRKLSRMNIDYVFGLENHIKNKERLFNSNGIHATEIYHELIANKLYSQIDIKIMKQMFNN